MTKNHLQNSIWIWGALIIPSLVMLPVLIWPHYGLFSDADQLIEFPNFIIDNPSEGLNRILKPLDDGRYQPLFYVLTILVFLLKPNSSLVFYVFQWLMLLVTSYIVAWVVFRETKSKWTSFFSVVLFCFSSSIFESFYTLDKIEPRSTFFSALILFFLVRHLSSENSQPRSNPWFFWILQTILGIWLVFSKETGIYLALSFAATLIACLLTTKADDALKNVLFISTIIQSTIVIVFYSLYKYLWVEGSGDGRYLTYSITPELVYTNFIYYLKSSPEIIVGLACAFYIFIKFLIKIRNSNFSTSVGIYFFISAGLVIYFSGILIWRWPLDYFLLPAHFFSAILIPIVLNKPFVKIFSNYRKAFYVVFLIIFIFFGKLIGDRIVNGFLIYQQDELKDDLVSLLAEPQLANQQFILTFNHPNSAEIGERIKYFSDRIRPKDAPIKMFHFWESDVNVISNLNRFQNSVGFPPNKNQLYDAQNSYFQDSGSVIIWKFGKGANSDPSLLWGYDLLRNGDILLIPFSKNLPSWVRARGLGMYTPNLYLPKGITVSEGQEISRKFGPWVIGWRILVVTNSTTSQGK